MVDELTSRLGHQQVGHSSPVLHGNLPVEDCDGSVLDPVVEEAPDAVAPLLAIVAALQAVNGHGGGVLGVGVCRHQKTSNITAGSVPGMYDATIHLGGTVHIRAN